MNLFYSGRINVLVFEVQLEKLNPARASLLVLQLQLTLTLFLFLLESPESENNQNFPHWFYWCRLVFKSVRSIHFWIVATGFDWLLLTGCDKRQRVTKFLTCFNWIGRFTLVLTGLTGIRDCFAQFCRFWLFFIYTFYLGCFYFHTTIIDFCHFVLWF